MVLSMKLLMIGGGGREHALIRKLKESPRVDEIYCAPGNGGIACDAQCVAISAMDIMRDWTAKDTSGFSVK